MDDDFDYGEDNYDGGLTSPEEGDLTSTQKSQVVQNQPHDEEVNLSDTESFAGGPDEPPSMPKGVATPPDASLIESHDYDDMPQAAVSHSPNPMRAQMAPMEALPTGGGAAAGGGGGEGEGNFESPPPGGYNALDYKHLNVSDEIRDLFKYIGRYKPHNIDLETKLKPFIPDYIPAVGGIDEFIKVPRPDGKPDFLGLKVLDEPAARQSDPTVLTLQLRQHSKEAPGNKAEMVGRIEHGDDQKPKKIQGWVQSIADIHKSKPPAAVNYAKGMPDIETLMQEWPPEMEAFIKTMKMPNGDLDVDLKTFVKMVCAVLDIPVYDNPIESLHVLFTLYLEFKNNPVFAQQLNLEALGATMNVTLPRGPGGVIGYGTGFDEAALRSSQQGINITGDNVNVMTF